MLCDRTENHLRDGVGDSLQKWQNRNSGRRGSGVVRAGSRALIRFWSASSPGACPALFLAVSWLEMLLLGSYEGS